MKKIVKELESIISKLDGKLVCIGLNESFLINKIKENQNIIYCDLLNSNILSKEKNNKKRKSKNLSIKDFRKYFKNKNINHIICNLKEIEKLLPKFIPDSIYINKDYIYLYGNKSEYDFDKIIKKYKRYNVEIEMLDLGDNSLLKINVKNSKNKYLKDKFYYIYDKAEKLVDNISDLIVS